MPGSARAILAIFFTAALFAQIAPIPSTYPGGGYPGGGSPGQYPPGQYPPGRYPSPGIPIPGRHKKGADSGPQESITTTTGIIRQIDQKSFVVEGSDKRVITFQVNDKTKFLRAGADSKLTDFAVGEQVDVDAHENDDASFRAVTVTLTKDQPSGNSVNQKYPEDPDEAPPTLKRGKPAPRPHKDSEESAKKEPPRASTSPASASAASEAPAVAPERPKSDTFLDKAREAAATFTSHLPNYVCKEYVTRYASQAKPPDWQAQDMVSTDVIYEDGKEQYRNIAVNGHKGKDPEKNGSWSTGEFGSILRDLFEPSTAARFSGAGGDVISGHTARVYEFTVEQPHSHWKIYVAGSQYIFPAYQGSVWFDAETARALRIEMQATHIPEEFPLDTVESAINYDFTSFGTTKYLVPAKAETLSCERGSNNCSRNVIEFRNYRKFEGEATITFEK